MKLPFSNTFWIIVIFLAFYGVFTIWVPNQTFENAWKDVDIYYEGERKEGEDWEFETGLTREEDRLGYNLSINDKLVFASEYGYIPKIKEYLNSGADINYFRDKTPLMAARSLEVAQLLISQGADIHVENKQGATALWYALHWGAYGDVKVVKLLLDKGAKVNKAPVLRLSLLRPAINENAPMDIIKLLVNKGENLNYDKFGLIDLVLAAVNKERTDLVAYLIEQGASLEHTGEEALARAINQENIEIVKLLVKHVKSDDKTKSKMLKKAITRGDVELVRLLIQEFKVSTEQLQNVLATAVSAGHFVVAKMIIDTGVDLEDERFSRRILWSALETRVMSTFEYLLEHGADINALNKWYIQSSGQTLLEYAAAHYNPDAIRILLKYGIKQKKSDSDKEKSLLIKVINSAWDYSYYAEEYAMSNEELPGGSKKMLGNVWKMKRDVLACVDLLLPTSKDIDAQDSRGDTALHLAVKKYLPDVVRKLLLKNASLLIVNNKNENALMVANEDIDVILEIINHGGEFNGPILKAAEDVDKYVLSANSDPALVEKIKRIRKLQSSSSDTFSYHGKIFNQLGEPVSGVIVKGYYTTYPYMLDGDSRTFKKKITMISDEQGLFSFSDKMGRAFSIVSFERKGFEFESGQTYNFSSGGVEMMERITSPDSPVVFKAWEIIDPELIIFSSTSMTYPALGQEIEFDFQRKGSVEQADLVVSFESADITNSDSLEFILKAVDGGIIESTDTFMNVAPKDGYQNEIIIPIKGDEKGALQSVSKKFFLKSRNGKSYARLEVDIGRGLSFQIAYRVNPRGSRNLQYVRSMVRTGRFKW